MILADTQDSYKEPEIALYSKIPFKGRRVIYSDYEKVTEDNLIEILTESITAHHLNAGQINYLWNYYKGVQPILDRTKEVRPEINNTVVENHAQEIVAFKVGYQLAEPLQYTTRMQSEEKKEQNDFDAETPSEYDKTLDAVNELNTLMFAEDKASCDRDLFEWMCICGVGYRMVEADTAEDVEDGGAPFEIYTLDPRHTFIVRSSAYHHKVLMSVWVSIDPTTKGEIYNVYTDTDYYLVNGNQIIENRPHTYKYNPIIEYRLNNARMGVFEPVLPLLDAINKIESNRLDDIEQTVQALLKFINCDIEETTFKEMLKLGAVKVKTTDPQLKADIDTIVTNLDQTGTQTTKDDLYQAVVNICGMPNRNGQGGSTSDTGAAVLLRDGWTLAEAAAKSYELQFKRAERDFLRVCLEICKQSSESNLDLRIRDIELAFNRRNYENILVKSQVLTTMLATNKVHPQLAFQACGLFTDPDAAYKQSCEYTEQNKEEFQNSALGQIQNDARNEANHIGSQATVPEPNQGGNAETSA